MNNAATLTALRWLETLLAAPGVNWSPGQHAAASLALREAQAEQQLTPLRMVGTWRDIVERSEAHEAASRLHSRRVESPH